MIKNAKKYMCENCCFYANKPCDWLRHVSTRKHKNSMIFNRKNNDNYVCSFCDVLCSNDVEFKQHIMTTGCHKKTPITPITPIKNIHKCNICNKEYKSNNSLWYHKKKCVLIPPSSITYQNENESNHKITNSFVSIFPQNYDFVVELLKQNNELQKQIIEMSKEPKIINYNTNSCNTTNNQFNINMFLNETCKNAINFSEFIDNIQVTYDDLENNAKMGFVNGMTKIIIDNLKQLELSNRPIHCTDIKRETIYIKEEDQWEKDTSKEVIQKGIQEITCKNIQQLSEWRDENPEYNDIDSNLGEISIIMQQQSMAGTKREEYYPKIIKNIAKETIVYKNKLLDN